MIRSEIPPCGVVASQRSRRNSIESACMLAKNILTKRRLEMGWPRPTGGQQGCRPCAVTRCDGASHETKQGTQIRELGHAKMLLKGLCPTSFFGTRSAYARERERERGAKETHFQHAGESKACLSLTCAICLCKVHFCFGSKSSLSPDGCQSIQVIPFLSAS